MNHSTYPLPEVDRQAHSHMTPFLELGGIPRLKLNRV